jgi:hypothetical protein
VGKLVGEGRLAGVLVAGNQSIVGVSVALGSGVSVMETGTSPEQEPRLRETVIRSKVQRRKRIKIM